MKVIRKPAKFLIHPLNYTRKSHLGSFVINSILHCYNFNGCQIILVETIYPIHVGRKILLILLCKTNTIFQQHYINFALPVFKATLNS